MKNNKNNVSLYILSVVLILIFFLYCGCISLSDSYKNPEKAENENDREESKDNTNKELKVIKLPDYVERITDVLQVFDDLVSVKDQESYEVSPEIEKIYPSVTIVASFANETPSWLSDKLFWKNDEKEISLNFVFIRENISLSAAKRLLEVDSRNKIILLIKNLIYEEFSNRLGNPENDNSYFLSYVQKSLDLFPLNEVSYEKEFYWQYVKKETSSKDAVYYYRYYILCKVSYKDYIKIVLKFLDSLKKDDLYIVQYGTFINTMIDELLIEVNKK